MRRDRPDIVWYCTDQQRSDTIRAPRNPRVRTPTRDRLAAAGGAFQRGEILRRHVAATMATSSAGVERAGMRRGEGIP